MVIQNFFKKLGFYLLILLVLIFTLFPFVQMLSTSLKHQFDWGNPSLIPVKVNLNAYEESLIIQKKIKKYYNKNWDKAVHFFADYWNGKGSWESYSNDQKVKFSEILKPNFHEWDAVLNETISIQELYKKLPKDTTFISALDTVFSIKEIKKILNYHCKTWNFKTINSGGHMAVIKNLAS